MCTVLQLVRGEKKKGNRFVLTCSALLFLIVFWELLTSQEPFEGIHAWQVPVLVAKGERLPLPEHLNPEVAKLIKSCWHAKWVFLLSSFFFLLSFLFLSFHSLISRPSRRPEFEEILNQLRTLHNDCTTWMKEDTANKSKQAPNFFFVEKSRFEFLCCWPQWVRGLVHYFFYYFLV
jgi:hypothetical protein